MVSERQLSRQNRFWWSYCAPGLDERWLAAVSLGNSKSAHRISQWAYPLTSSLPPVDSDLVAEIAFGVFACALDNGIAIASLAPEKIRIVVAQAVARIELLRGSGRDLSSVVTPDHIAFATILASRLLDWTALYSDTIEVQPRLPGTGIVDACHPDLIAGVELIEVKMARTIFRLSDIRQVLVYVALAWLGTDRRLQSVSLTNPMLGISWSFDLHTLIREISGESPARFFDKFDRLSRGEVVG
jgi:hypothetical protein